MRDNERRRDYRMQIDDYHKVLAEDKLDLSKKEKAVLARESIKAEAEYVKNLGEEQRKMKYRQMDQYNHDLASQINTKARQWTQDGLVDDVEYGKHTGLNIGEYNEPSKDELLRTLKVQVENKNKQYNRLDKIETRNVAQGGDWLGRKEQIDKWNYEYIHDHRRRNMEGPKDNTKLLEMKEMAIKENARKRRECVKQKQSDINLVNDLVQNERHQRYEEYCKHKDKTEILQNAYETQMNEKQILQQYNRAEKENEAKGTSFIHGAINSFGNANYDYRNDISNNEARKQNKSKKFRNADHEIVDNLDHYDRVMMHNERERKAQQKEELNCEYNMERARVEGEKEAEIDAKKHLRPVVYGMCESPKKCYGHKQH